MDISVSQLQAIRSWAERTALVKRVILFGSRAKGTSRADSDTDIALELEAAQGDQRDVFHLHGQRWQKELRQHTGLEINIDWMNTVTSRAVAEHGIELFSSKASVVEEPASAMSGIEQASLIDLKGISASDDPSIEIFEDGTIKVSEPDDA